jgi:thiamine-monophosphate kinase
MREIELVESIKKFAQHTYRSKMLIEGIGDDCAVLRPKPGRDLVFTTDLTIEDRHFTLETHSAADIGHKSLARSLSDLAAMGAEPVFCLVSLAVPVTVKAAWISGFYRTLTKLALKARISLAGGDLARAGKVTVDVMCCGAVPEGAALLRSGARPGDAIYVTGELGGSALGFQLKRGRYWLRHRRPEARLDVGRKIARYATAAMDLSDGLSLDLQRLCRESRVGASLTGPLPLAKGASLEQALHGGEDYELLFTAPPKRNVPAKIAGVPITRIGEITQNTGTITYKERLLEPLGFDHFR